jgi:quercetin dioxygenase-like cupin family protein
MNRLNIMTTRRRVLPALAALAIAAGSVGVAWATGGIGLTITSISGPAALGDVSSKSEGDGLEAEIQLKGESDVFVAHIRIAPNGEGGWHYHPGPSIISVKSGVASFFHADAPTTALVYPAGKGFVEDAYVVHNVKNLGTTDVELVVLQIVPKGAPRRIDAPAP